MKFKIIDTNITSNQHWVNSITYIITTKIEVFNNTTLKIDNNTKILLLNNSYSSITFNPGSKLCAKKIESFAITSYDMKLCTYSLATTSLNGGWIFLGNYKSKIRIKQFTGSFLGSSELNAISFNDMNNNLCKMSKLKLINCINNVYLNNSSIQIKKIKIYDAVFAFNLNNSSLNIKDYFNIYLVSIGKLIYGNLNKNIIINKYAYFSLIAMNPEQIIQNISFISNDERVNGAIPPYNLTNINNLKELLTITIKNTA